MLVDLIVAAPAPLLVAGVAVYAAVMLHLVARDIERARWQREFGRLACAAARPHRAAGATPRPRFRSRCSPPA